jgi:hypothetical protein
VCGDRRACRRRAADALRRAPTRTPSIVLRAYRRALQGFDNYDATVTMDN